MTMTGIVMVWLGLYTVKENKTRNLSQVDKIDGVIDTIGVLSQDKKVGTFPFRAYKKTDLLIIKMSNDNTKLGTFNPKQNYNDLINKLKHGDSIRVYYYKTNDFTNNIYQLEMNKEILVSHSDYKKNDTIAGIVILGFGLFIFLMNIMFIRTYK